MRVSNLGVTDRLRDSITANNDRLARVEVELSTGKRINAPSDDPTGTGSALLYRASVASDDQLTRTLDTAKTRLTRADAALGSLTDVLQRARELTVQAGAGIHTAADLNSMATEMNQLLQQAVQIGNSNVAGQYLFGGTKTTAAPFAASGAYPAAVTYNGNDHPVAVDIGGGSTLRVDVPGDTAFSATMQALIQVRDSLQSGNATGATSAGLPAIDSALDGLLQVRASTGARVNQITDTQTRVAADSLRLQALKSGIEDTDLADASIRLSAARTTYDAALNATAKALQSTLVDFLR